MKARVLIADDEPEIVTLIKLTLEGNDYQVLIARDGKEAMELAQREKPDMILLDILMPFLNGYEICSRLKRNEKLKHIPIIMISGYFRYKDRQIAQACSADGFIPKPYTFSMLLDEVERALRRGG